MIHHGFNELVANGGFRAFLCTQFLGALNNNIYRTIVTLTALHVNRGKYVSLVLGIFVLPALLFSGYAGHLADVISKRRVLIGAKLFEVLVVGLAFTALTSGSIAAMLVTVFLAGIQSTLFSPAKYGIVPEILAETQLSRANALLEMTTFLAIVLGQACGAFLFSAWKAESWKMGIVLLAVALVGLIASLGINNVPPSGAKHRFYLGPFTEIATGTRTLVQDRMLLFSAAGVCYFWFFAAVVQPALGYFGTAVLRATDIRLGFLWTFLAIGLAGGNLLAGRLSGNRVEMRLASLGAAGMGIFVTALCLLGGSYVAAVGAILLLALASGVYVVPLYTCIQQRADPCEKGRVIATTNFYQTLGMILASGAVWYFHDHQGFSASAIFLCLGLLTAVLTGCVLLAAPQFRILRSRPA